MTSTSSLGEVRVGNRHRGDKGLYVGRGTVFGNPFTVEEHGREEALELYSRYLHDEIQLPWSKVGRAIDKLGRRVSDGENFVLLCSCAPKACHADILRFMILESARALQSRTSHE